PALSASPTLSLHDALPISKTLLLGAAAQFGIFSTVLGAVALSAAGLMDFSLADAAAIGIIGGADGPTAIFVSSRLAPELLGAIADRKSTRLNSSHVKISYA